MPFEKADPNLSSNSHRHTLDPDSTFKGAHKLQPSDFEDGNYTTGDTLTNVADVDIWRVHLSAGATLQVTTDSGTDDPNTVLSLFDHRGYRVSFDDTADDLESFLSYTAPQSSNYFVAVSELVYPEGGDFAHDGPEINAVPFINLPPNDYFINFEII